LNEGISSHFKELVDDKCSEHVMFEIHIEDQLLIESTNIGAISEETKEKSTAFGDESVNTENFVFIKPFILSCGLIAEFFDKSWKVIFLVWDRRM
jgi:hypothetical protein